MALSRLTSHWEPQPLNEVRTCCVVREKGAVSQNGGFWDSIAGRSCYRADRIAAYAYSGIPSSSSDGSKYQSLDAPNW
jgi:hypothetical protein